MALQPLESACLISKHAKDVSISMDGVKSVAKMIGTELEEGTYSIKKWKEHEVHPKTIDDSTIDWIFLVDTLNFSFWADNNEHYTVRYKEKIYTGYFALCAAVNRAIEDGFPITSSDYYATVSIETLQHIFRSETKIQIPLIEERLKILHETGKHLVKEFAGSFKNVLTLCNSSAQELVKMVVKHFPSYRDEATIDGHQVSFYKRAQILVSDIWACFEGKSYGKFDDIQSITVFADYRVPQALVYLGVLVYSEELLKTLNEGISLENGDRQEVEIRGCTIWAVELICQEIKQQVKESKAEAVNACLLDYYLWDYRRKYAEEMKRIPFHKTRCIYY